MGRRQRFGNADPRRIVPARNGSHGSWTNEFALWLPSLTWTARIRVGGWGDEEVKIRDRQ